MGSHLHTDDFQISHWNRGAASIPFDINKILYNILFDLYAHRIRWSRYYLDLGCCGKSGPFLCDGREGFNRNSWNQNAKFNESCLEFQKLTNVLIFRSDRTEETFYHYHQRSDPSLIFILIYQGKSTTGSFTLHGHKFYEHVNRGRSLFSFFYLLYAISNFR